MALGQHGFGKIVCPTGFRGFHLQETAAQGFGSRLRLPALDEFCHGRQPFGDTLFVPWIAAEQKVVQVQAVLHDQVTHRFNRAHTFERCGGVCSRGPFFPAREDVGDEQKQQENQTRAESEIKSITNRHRKKPPLTPPCAAPGALRGILAPWLSKSATGKANRQPSVLLLLPLK